MTRRLTQAELGIWLGHQRAEDPAVYNAAEGLLLQGPLDGGAFERALERTLQEAGSLQVKYVERNGEPRCEPYASGPARLRVVDLSARPEPRAALERAVDAELGRPFCLERGELFEHYLYRLEPERHVWVHRAHHVALDGYGFNLIARRLAEYYAAETGGRPAPPGTFATAGDVAREDMSYDASQARQNDRRFWLDELASTSAPVLGGTEQALAPAHGARASRLLTAAQQTALRELSRSLGVEWTELAIALVAVLVHETTGARDLSLGLPVMLRFGTAALRVPCMAMNIVPVPVHVEPNATLGSLAQQLRATLARARPHLRYRYEHLKLEPELGRRAFGPVVNLIPFEPPRQLGACSAEPIGFSAGPVEDVAFTFRQRRGALELATEGHPAAFSSDQLAAVNERLLALLAAPQRPFAASAGNPVEPFLARLLAHVRERPHHVALEEGELRLTYAQLAAATRAAAANLVAHGAVPGRFIALDVPRSALAWVLVLAAHWVGAGYAALDPHQPAPRRDAMLRALRPCLLVRRADSAGSAPNGLPVLELSDDTLRSWLEAPAGPELRASDARRPAYAVFTSGSTGEPKGVVIERGALDHFVTGALPTYGFAASDRVLQFAALSFDASVEEALVTWAAGATLVLRDDGMLSSMPDFVGRCRERGVTVLDLPTAFWHELCLSLGERVIALPPAVRLVIVGGEAAAPERLRQWQAHAGNTRLLNTYGPSEATIVATCAELTTERSDRPVPIGRPLPFVTALLLDEARRVVTEPGRVAELCLLGPTLSRGYLGRDDLTRERFVELPGHGRAYLTFDLAHWDEQGRLIYAGRLDDELKISGHRIAPAEVERALATHPRVRASVVQGERGRSGAVHLVAHVEAPEEGVTGAELRRFLATLLPAVMIPSVIQLTALLPRTTHGKLDRNALRGRASAATEATGATGATVPSPELELVLSAWREVLGDVALGADDDFFAVGGSSLQVIQLANRLSRRGAALSVASVFRHPTPRKQAELLRGHGADEKVELEPVSLDPAWFASPARGDGRVARVLLTGATGFVGAYLLRQLLKETTCHVTVAARARDDAHAARRLAETSERYGFELDGFASRLRSVALPRGLESLEPLDAVLNCAAEVSLTRDYGSLRASNVLLVRDLIAAAGRWGASFHQVSSVAALPDGTTSETFATRWSGSSDGYRQSKWQAEGLCVAAAEAGLAVAVYRLGRVAAAENAPRINGRDIVWRVAAASAHVGGWPDLQVREPWIPVDESARTIVELMLRGSARTPARAYHLTHTGHVDLERLRRVLSELGLELPRLPLPAWLARVKQHGSSEHLATAAFFELAPASPGQTEPRDWSWDNVRALLPSAREGEISDQLLRAYAEAALAQGVLTGSRWAGRL